jgi:uncharacterized protein (TIGR02996 family)
MTATTDQAALLRAILDNLDEDTPRLMYADEIERDDPDRAELIRLQCRVAELDAEANSAEDCEDQRCVICSERRPLVARAFEIKKRLTIPLWAGERPGEAADIGATMRRGFYDEITCHLRHWVGRGPAIVKAHPTVRLASLVDIRPSPITTEDGRIEWTFFIGTIDTGYHVPQGIYYRLTGPWNHSSFAASDALKVAAVAWARDEGQLPF